MISQKARYALRALIALARANSLLIVQIAEEQRIPRKFLEQILLDLKRHGIVASRSAARITTYAVALTPYIITIEQ